MRRDEAYLFDILDASRNIKQFTEGKTFEEFSDSYLLQLGISKLLEIIGESAKNVSKQFKIDHPEIPWERLRKFRNDLAHEYFRVDLKEVWSTSQEIIPKLIPLLEPLIPPSLF